MSEESKAVKDIATSFNQLHHILKTKYYTYCLICMEIIPSNFDSSAEDYVLSHLDSSNHQESVKHLFKTCHPNLSLKFDNKVYEDILLKSVFDISLLLGKETCYFSRMGKDLICLMCHKLIPKTKKWNGKLKQRIDDHILSERHMISVRDVCWVYKLNTENNFLLLHKSVLYCSVCQETYRCKESELLKVAVEHLNTNSHIRLQNCSSVRTEVYSVKKEDGDVKDSNVTSIKSFSETPEEDVEKYDVEPCFKCGDLVEIVNALSMKNHLQKHISEIKSCNNLTIDQELNIFVCGSCKVELLLMSDCMDSDNYGKQKVQWHCKRFHKEHYKKTKKDLLKKIVSRDQYCFRNAILQHFPNFDRLVHSNLVIKQNSQFMKILSKKSFCSLCWIPVKFHYRPKSFLHNFICHFKSEVHIQTLEGNETFKEKVGRRKLKILKWLNKRTLRLEECEMDRF